MEGDTQPGRNGGVLKKGGTIGPGRPPKLAANVIAALLKEGYTEVSATDVSSVYKLLLNVPIDQLKTMANAADQPALVRVVARALVQGKGLDVVERMVDRAHGRTVNTLAVQASGQGGQTENVGAITGVTITIVGGVQPPITSEAELDNL